jgi:phosphoglucomutase/phosphomannomutase
MFLELIRKLAQSVDRILAQQAGRKRHSQFLRNEMPMSLVDEAIAGFRAVNGDEALTDQAGKYLRQWLTQPEFADYRPQLDWLIETRQWAGLLDRFYQILPFGTGGRRGAVGIGPNRMNRWTLGASVQGHCEYLKERFPGVLPLKVVVAYDVRRFEDQRRSYNPDLPNPVLHLTSKDLAHHAVCVYAASGVHSHILPEASPRYLATPELSFAIRHLAAHGGLNISASHNPPDDNGGKFYDERGAQPVPPEDQIMAELVDQVTAIKLLPWKEAVRTAKVHFLDDSVHRAYVDLCRKQSLVRPPRRDEMKIVFTPLHGVGGMTALEVLREQGFHVLPVEEQMTPDGQFPNVTQAPNPEVPAALDLAEDLARECRADLVIATDPDADRVGAMCPRCQSAKDVRWRYVTGNELCALLVHFKLRRLAEEGMLPNSPIVVKTLVTTGMVSRIARAFGAQLVDNLLVGCKYIGDVLWQLEQNGRFEEVQGTPADFVIGCEESHGFLLTPQIRDKDAASAALLLAELALDCKRQGSFLGDYLDNLSRRFGYFCNLLVPLVMPGLEGKQNMARMMEQLRSAPPREIGGMPVTAVTDLRDEDNWLGPLKGATDLAARNFLVFTLGGKGTFAGRISLRPSGTEPKAKAYVEVCSSPCPAHAAESDWLQTCQQVDTLARQIADRFVADSLALSRAGNR